jgi:AcrR family transcriptional regulator
MTKRAGNKPKPRRKPVQSRSQESSRAVQQAFVRLLDEKPYAQVTIREITMVAGVGLGTFYDYFDSKEALARACVHLRTKALLHALSRACPELGAYDLATGIAAAINRQVAIFEEAPREWRQHFLLERQKSDLKYYLSAYEAFVEAWRALIVGASDWPQERPAAEPARLMFTLIYGMFAHVLMRGGPRLDFGALRRDLTRAALACL